MELEQVFFEAVPMTKFKDNKFYMDTFNLFKDELEMESRNMKAVSYECMEIKLTIDIVKEMHKLAELQEGNYKKREVDITKKGYEGFFIAETCRELSRRYGGLLQETYGVKNTYHLSYTLDNLERVLKGWEDRYLKHLSKARIAFDKIVELNTFVNNLQGA